MARRILFAIALAIAWVALVAAGPAAPDFKWMSKDELRSALDDPGLTVIDVRLGKDWEGSDTKVKGAVRKDPRQVEQWAKSYPKDRRMVLY